MFTNPAWWSNLFIQCQLDDTVPEEICISLEENRKEIEEALLFLASRSDEKHRRLDDSIYKPVTSFELGSEMLSFFDCYCDKSNPGNDGCSKKTLMFAEAVTKTITQKTEAIAETGENPAEILLEVRGNQYFSSTCTERSLISLCLYRRHTNLWGSPGPWILPVLRCIQVLSVQWVRPTKGNVTLLV